MFFFTGRFSNFEMGFWGMMMMIMTMMTMMMTMMMMIWKFWQANSIVPRCLGYRYMYRLPEVCHFDKVVDVAGPSSMEVRYLLLRNNNKNGKEKEQVCHNMKINRWSSSPAFLFFLHRTTAHMMYGGKKKKYLFHTHTYAHTHKRP